MRGVYSGPPTAARCERKLKPLLARYQGIFFLKLTNFWKNICKQVSSTQKRVGPHEIFSQVTRRILKTKLFLNKNVKNSFVLFYLSKFRLRDFLPYISVYPLLPHLYFVSRFPYYLLAFYFTYSCDGKSMGWVASILCW